MKRLERILALIETGFPVRLGEVELRSDRAGGARRYSFHTRFSAFGEPLENEPAIREEVLEYLVWLALFDAGRAQELDTLARRHPASPEPSFLQEMPLVEAMRQEDPALVGRVERFPDLLEPACRLLVELLERGDRFGCGNRESYENLYFRDNHFCWEAGDPLAGGPDQVCRIASREACVQFLKRDGWWTFEDGLLRGRGDLGWKLRHFLHEEAHAASLRLYLERKASAETSPAAIITNTNSGW